MRDTRPPKVYTVMGDPHVKPNNLDKIAELFEEVERLGNDIICLGDVFDTKEIIRGKCLNYVYDRLRTSKLQWIILVGNHDQFDAEGSDHSLRVLNELKNVCIVDQLTVQYSRDTRMLFLPYFHDLNKFRKALARAKSMMTNNKYHTVLFMHQGVNNFDFGNGVVENNGIELDELSDFNLVISGHFHKRQEEGNLIYVGTPFSHSFGESNQTKYIMTLDTIDLEINWTETNFPKHLTTEVNCDKEPFDFKIQSGQYHRFILTGLQKNIDKFPRKDYPGVKFIERPQEISLSTSIKEDQSPVRQFKEWAAQKKLTNEAVSTGVEILDDV